MKRTCKLIVAIAQLLLVPGVLYPADKASIVQVPSALFLQSSLHVRRFDQVKVSPDGKRVAWIELRPGKGTTAQLRMFAAELASPSSAHPIAVSIESGPHSETGIVWSPDSKKIAFLSDIEKPGQLQLYVADPAGGVPKELTHLKGFLANPHWSPDEKSIAVLYTENAPRAAGPLMPETPDEGVVESRIYEQRLTLVDPATKDVRQISPADMYIYEYDWSPDSKKLAVTAAHGPGDNNWWIAQLYTVDINSREMRSICKPATQIAAPRWSPDGKTIAFIGGLMSDEDSVGGDIFAVSSDGTGQVRDITPDMRASASWISWTPSSQKIVFTQFIGGSSGIATASVAEGAVNELWTGPERFSSRGFGMGASFARDGNTMALVRQSFEQPPEVWAGPIGAWRQITHRNTGLKPSWGAVKSLEWTSDGFKVQGWLMYPRDFDPGRRYPMVVSIHGGPASASLPVWPSDHDYPAALSTAGYFVLYPNPRGSFGRGEKFTKANVKAFGYGDFRDILAGVDEAIKAEPIDPDRIGITGWSYGGYMTMWAVTQTNRFHAAMAGAGLADWQSYYGENSIDEWMIPYFGASAYDDPAVYARSSPITFIKNVKTPTLVVVGDRDGECPTPQSYEFWHALKTLGIKAQFVIYQNEGHLIVQSAHRRDIIERTITWFNTYLK